VRSHAARDLAVDFEAALDTWRWLLRTEVSPVLVTALGDVFVRSGDAVLVDTFEGKLGRVADSLEIWKSEMSKQHRLTPPGTKIDSLKAERF
jgi:hypothetical protein